MITRVLTVFPLLLSSVFADYGYSLTPVPLKPAATTLYAASSWEGDVLPTPEDGLVGIVDYADALLLSIASTIYDYGLIQEGVSCLRDGDLLLRGGDNIEAPGRILWTVNDQTDYPASHVHLHVTGNLVMWSQYGGDIEINLLHGRIEIDGALRMFERLGGESVINVKDGSLTAQTFRASGSIINMLKDGAGAVVIAAFETTDRNLAFNFIPGNRGSITILQKETGDPFGETDWQILANAGKLLVDGVPAGIGHFVLEDGGTTLRHIGAFPGLTVVDGKLYKDGVAYRAIGVNYFDLFYAMLTEGPDAEGTYRTIEGLRFLGERGVPFARFSAGGFWPVDWDLYFSDKEEWFARLDLVVATAEEVGVGLIPSVFWRVNTFPELFGEYREAWADPSSLTRQFMATYTNEILARYKDSPAIWGWEFGNEFNNMCDLPNWDDGLGTTLPNKGSVGPATEVDVRNKYTYAIAESAFGAFTQTVRLVDSHRFISNGNSRPRPAAWHNRMENNWNIDTYLQAQEAFSWIQPPASIDMASFHVYPYSMAEPGVEPVYADATGVAAILLRYREFCDAQDQAMFVGEYSSFYDGQGAPPELERAEESALLDAIVASGADLAAYWVFDRGLPEVRTEIGTIRQDNDYLGVLDLLLEYDARMRGEVHHTQAGVPVDWFHQFSIEPLLWQTWAEIEGLDLNQNGMTLLDEYMTGIHPIDTGPVFSIVQFQVFGDGTPSLSWWGGTHGSMAPYLIQSATSLQDPAGWQNIGTTPRVDGLNSWSGSPSSDPIRFYRVFAGPE